MTLLEAALFILAIQLFCFVFAAIFKTDKLTDISYGLTFVCLALWQLFHAVEGAPAAGPGLWAFYGLQLAVVLWGLRLAFFLFYRIHKMGRDERFDGRREHFWRFAAFWALQAVSIWIIYLPGLLPGAGASALWSQSLTWLAVGIGFLAALLGLILEAVADQQKFRFRQDPANRGRFIQTGLWRNARYPNYGGEILFWWGLFVVVTPLLSGWHWIVVLSPVWITFLLLRISGIPLLEEAALKKYGASVEYQNYVQQSRLLWPI